MAIISYCDDCNGYGDDDDDDDDYDFLIHPNRAVNQNIHLTSKTEKITKNPLNILAPSLKRILNKINSKIKTLKY